MEDSPGSGEAFPARLRLRHDLEFQRVYAARVSRPRGVFVAFACPNALPYWRLGLSVGKRVGNAVTRNALKRRLREAFRLAQGRLPRTEEGGYDLILAARAHDPLAMAEYQSRLVDAAHALHADWVKKTAP